MIPIALASSLPSTDWIRDLAQPYLRGYRPRGAHAGDLRGFWFDAPGAGEQAGFFTGYLVAADRHGHLNPQPPECVVFAFVQPESPLHRVAVREEGSLLRRTFEYIRWLTHRPPRFELFTEQLTTMIRHRSMRDWPTEKFEHFSRNFFIESLAWLVRSGLVRKLAEEAKAPLPKVRGFAAHRPKGSRKVRTSRRKYRRPIAKSRTNR
jgi:hypothetical protein